jgi:hypothetical protein
MVAARIMRGVLAGLLFGAAWTAGAQSMPASGVYRIVSGTYVEVGGFIGTVPYALPQPNQAWVELLVDTQRDLADLTFLAEDRHSVLRTFGYPNGSGVAFGFRGAIDPGQMAFRNLLVPTPETNAILVDYQVSYTNDELRINGMLETQVYGSDIPSQFLHTNVIAVLMPRVTARLTGAGAIELRWDSISNRTYQVQRTSDLGSGTNAWVDLSAPLPGEGGPLSFTNSMSAGEARQFYRVLSRP